MPIPKVAQSRERHFPGTATAVTAIFADRSALRSMQSSTPVASTRFSLSSNFHAIGLPSQAARSMGTGADLRTAADIVTADNTAQAAKRPVFKPPLQFAVTFFI
jgi:hypothetical protein